MRRFAIALLVVCLLSFTLCELAQTSSATVTCSDSSLCGGCKAIKTVGYMDSSNGDTKTVMTCTECSSGSPKEFVTEKKGSTVTGSLPSKASELCFGNLMGAISAAFIALVALFMN